MRILSLDPGMTTGYALINQDGTLLESGNLLNEDLSDSVLVKLEKEENLCVVVEDVPIPTNSKMNRDLMQVKFWMMAHFPQAVQVLPGTWKNHLGVANYPLPWGEEDKGITQHQKDAFRIGIWYIITYIDEA